MTGMLNVLFVGRLEKRKGLTYLLQALQTVQESGTHRVRLIVVGAFAEAQRAEYEKKAVQLGLSNVVFVGFVSREEKVPILQVMPCVLRPVHGRRESGHCAA